MKPRNVNASEVKKMPKIAAFIVRVLVVDLGSICASMLVLFSVKNVFFCLTWKILVQCRKKNRISFS